jgi:hypothetical protein
MPIYTRAITAAAIRTGLSFIMNVLYTITISLTGMKIVSVAGKYHTLCKKPENG